MAPKSDNAKPRRSNRQQGIELSSDVGLRKHRRSKKKKLGAESDHVDKHVADVLGSDLAGMEDDHVDTNEEVAAEDDHVDTNEKVAAEYDHVDNHTDEEVAAEDDHDVSEEVLAGDEEEIQQPSNEHVPEEVQANNKKSKTRGPTKMRNIANHHDDKVVVEFTSIGEHVGDGSVTLSSFFGPLVREHVPILLNNWRYLPVQTKDTFWEEIHVLACL
ncbi:PREDICTED: uncharacterized protein LOC104707137 [Camelina sativa]|uniref:Uncharacterized protein LOC104707137 n=1 Tax=Camelina sativa TaxID=90675 RepID=A0ABM0T6R4_CAMSA|nr:PREDICTED: uncharacterized protein LOC104707137 [Camelina sativa]